MKRTNLIATLGAFALALTAVPGAAFAADAKPLTAAEKQKLFLDETGGFIQHRNAFKGTIAIVDAQEACPARELNALVRDLVSITEFHAAYVRGSAALAKLGPLELGPAALKETKAELAVVVVSRKDLPPSLVAVESHWALVNVDALRKGLPAGKLGDVMFAARCRKETMRAYSIVCGGSGSQYQGTIVNALSPEDLDKLDETIPLDTILAYRPYLKRLGVTPSHPVTWRQAYIQGWAPAPTNDHQRVCAESAKAEREDYLRRKAEKDALRKKKPAPSAK